METIFVRMQISNVLVLMYVLSSAYCEICRENCHIGRVQGFRSTDCYRREITEVPQCLPKNTEILDLSFNRIREITTTDFASYPYLQILYLSDNILTQIDDHALDDQYNLHTIDVSNNPFYIVPKALFSLPALRKLTLASIRKPNMVEDIESAPPITSPLVHLDLSQNKLPRLPNLGELPSLQYYNVSGNKNIKLNTSMFAGLCNLQELINEDFAAIFERPCDCQTLERWLMQRNVKFNSFKCDETGKGCANQIPETDLDVFNNCRRLHEIQQQQLYKKKLLTNVGISVGTIVGFLLILLFIIFRRNKRLKQKKKIEKEAHMKQTKEVIDDQGLL